MHDLPLNNEVRSSSSVVQSRGERHTEYLSLPLRMDAPGISFQVCDGQWL